MEDILRVEHLRKTFHLSKKQMKISKEKQPIKVAVDDLSFKAYKGEIFGLLGPNGAGKTTTLRTIATLIKADSGDCFVDNISVKEHPEQVRARIGFLTSELKLEDFFTPNYLFDYFASLHQVDPKIAQETKAELFKQFGIEEFKHVKVGDLSTGMKQKLSIVISLVHNPDVIIFDEPTNGLDVITAKVVTDFLLDLKKRGKTIILSTHIFSLVEKLCDRVGIIVNGHMAKEGTLSELTKEKNLEELFFDIYSSEVQK